ncbi:MAG: aryl-sulfate sulfotransferase [Candidatus Kapaibacteriota bacterium]
MKNFKNTEIRKNVTKGSKKVLYVFKSISEELMALIFSIFILVLSSFNLFSFDITYVYPKPNSDLNSVETPIILKFARPIQQNDIEKNINIVGEKSGNHQFKYSLSKDGKTISLSTTSSFATEEKVKVKFFEKEYVFTTSKVTPEQQKLLFTTLFADKFPELSAYTLAKEKLNQIDEIQSDTIPADFPKIIINSVRNPAPGYIYIANFGMGAERSYLMILDNNGNPIKYKKVPMPGFDFKMQPNGLITNARIITSHIPQGWGWAEAHMEVMNENLEVIDTVQCKGGYIADFHDFKMLPNGNYLLISYDPQPIDMSKVVPGGNPNAIVLGSIIQELDADKNVVFQWRSWDHIPMTDTYAPLNGIALDPVHINAVELDYDGNLLISSRHISEITKISRETGEIIWRLGGKKNMFTFINEHSENAPNYFSYQHDIRRQPNGNITLYDNGNQHPTPYSRAVEYRLDETNMTAELVWEYRNNPDIYGETMGSTQRLPNGNTVIGWGGVTQGHIRNVTEVNPQGEIEFELSFPKGVTFQVTSYRAYRYPYPPNQPEVVITKSEISSIVNPNQPPYDSLHFNNREQETGVTIVFSKLIDQSPSEITVSKYFYAPMYPRFVGETPLVNPYKIIVSTNNIEQATGKIVISLSQYPMLLHRKNLSIWRRVSANVPFEKLPSSFDEQNGILSAEINSLDGEYIIATSDFKNRPEPPILTAPFNNAILNTTKDITFQWTPRNVVTSSEILVSKDENFVYVVYNSNGLKENILKISPLPAGKYYWKVRCSNKQGQSDWSEPFSFEVKEPYLRILSPKAADIWIKENDYTIEWEHNLDPDFMITLYQGNSPLFNVVDSIYSVYGKYSWKIQNIIEPASNYKIRITSLKVPNMFAESGNFSIQEPSSVEETKSSFIVYPNPADRTIFVAIQNNEVKSYKIIDALGRIVAEGKPQTSNDSMFTINISHIATGVYLILLDTNDGSLTQQIILRNN